jgi:hypothetical protein
MGLEMYPVRLLVDMDMISGLKGEVQRIHL